MELRHIDLNLLNVFDAVIKHRSVAQAAAELAVSPSAISHALARLRQMFKDELFLRSDAGMQPTPRALELSRHIHGGLTLLERALADESFIATESARRFRVAAGDYVCSLILPRLVQHLTLVAPHVDLQVIPASRIDVGRQLDRAAVDLVIGWFGALSPGIRRQKLMRERGVFVVRAGHPLTKTAATWEDLFDYPHIVVELTGPESNRDDGFLNDRGLVRRVWMERAVLEARGRPDLAVRVAVTVPHFTAVPPILLVSDFVATLPLSFAQLAARSGEITMLDPALESGSIDVEIAWHARGDTDTGLSWLREELTTICRSPAPHSVRGNDGTRH